MPARLELLEGVVLAEGSAALSVMTRNAAGEEINGTYELIHVEDDVWRLAPETKNGMRRNMAEARA